MKLSTGSKCGIGFGAAFFIAAVVGGFLAGCAGQTVRNEVLVPAMQEAWPGIQVNAAAGGISDADLAVFMQALATGDRVAIVGIWPLIHPAAVEGIESRLTMSPPQIGPGVAAVLRLNVSKFNQAVGQLQKKLF